LAQIADRWDRDPNNSSNELGQKQMRKRTKTSASITLVLSTVVTLCAAEIVSLPAGDIANGTAKLPQSGAVSTGQPDAGALRIAADKGYVAVIDLRGIDENRGLDEKAAVESLGMRYVSLPIADKTAVNYSNAARLDKVMAELDGPVLLHCGSGNRVGALIALRARLRGASAAEALIAGKTAGLTSLEPAVQERLAESPREIPPD
jgi:uncharacterized protein (TIGR01244 family)